MLKNVDRVLVEVTEPVSHGEVGIVCSAWTCGTWHAGMGPGTDICLDLESYFTMTGGGFYGWGCSSSSLPISVGQSGWFRTMCLILRAPETSFIANSNRRMVFDSAIHSAWCVSKQRGIQQTRTWSDTQSLSRHPPSGFAPVPCVQHLSSRAPQMSCRSPHRCSGKMRGPTPWTGTHLWKTGAILVTWKHEEGCDHLWPSCHHTLYSRKFLHWTLIYCIFSTATIEIVTLAEHAREFSCLYA